MPEEIRELVKADKLTSGHFWKDTLANHGNQKPYFIGKGSTNAKNSMGT